jgi:SAM-dependent methyltransferase
VTTNGYHTVFHRDASHDELTRLDGLARVCNPHTQRYIAALDIPPGARVLEIGCGDGSMAQWFADTLRPDVLAVLDRDEGLLQRLPIPEAVRIHADLTDPQYRPPTSFTLIHARAVLMHLPQRDDLLTTLASWLEPGGWLVIGDGVNTPELCHNPVIQAATRAMWHAAAQVMNSDHEWALRVPERMRSAGLTVEGFGIDVPTLQPGSPLSTMLELSMTTLAARTDPDTAELIGRAIQQLRQPDLLTGSPLTLVTTCGRKPA